MPNLPKEQTKEKIKLIKALDKMRCYYGFNTFEFDALNDRSPGTWRMARKSSQEISMENVTKYMQSMNYNAPQALYEDCARYPDFNPRLMGIIFKAVRESISVTKDAAIERLGIAKRETLDRFEKQGTKTETTVKKMPIALGFSEGPSGWLEVIKAYCDLDRTPDPEVTAWLDSPRDIRNQDVSLLESTPATSLSKQSRTAQQKQGRALGVILKRRNLSLIDLQAIVFVNEEMLEEFIERGGYIPDASKPRILEKLGFDSWGALMAAAEPTCTRATVVNTPSALLPKEVIPNETVRPYVEAYARSRGLDATRLR
jgi:hypothetical protein